MICIKAPIRKTELDRAYGGMLYITGRFVIYSFDYRAVNLLLCKSPKGIEVMCKIKHI